MCFGFCNGSWRLSVFLLLRLLFGLSPGVTTVRSLLEVFGGWETGWNDCRSWRLRLPWRWCWCARWIFLPVCDSNARPGICPGRSPTWLTGRSVAVRVFGLPCAEPANLLCASVAALANPWHKPLGVEATLISKCGNAFPRRAQTASLSSQISCGIHDSGVLFGVEFREVEGAIAGPRTSVPFFSAVQGRSNGLLCFFKSPGVNCFPGWPNAGMSPALEEARLVTVAVRLGRHGG